MKPLRKAIEECLWFYNPLGVADRLEYFRPEAEEIEEVLYVAQDVNELQDEIYQMFKVNYPSKDLNFSSFDLLAQDVWNLRSKYW